MQSDTYHFVIRLNINVVDKVMSMTVWDIPVTEILVKIWFTEFAEILCFAAYFGI